MKRIDSIQALRALSILLVILHHARLHYDAMGGANRYIKIIGDYGFIGVDIFFVISGFVIYKIVSSVPQTPDNAVRFLKTRLIRVFPFYWMILPLYAITAFGMENRQIDIIGSIFLLQPDMYKLMMNVSWSLTAEFVFYLVVTFCFLLHLNYIKFFTFYALAVILNICLRGDTYLLNPFVLEFFLGMLIAKTILPISQRVTNKSLKILVVALCSCVALMVFYANMHAQVGDGKLFRPFYYGTIGGLLVVAALFVEWGRSKPWSTITLVGDASFGIYLLHVFILWVCYEAGIVGFFRVEKMPNLGLAILFLINILIGIYWYKLVEHPVYLKLKNRIGRAT